MIIKGSFFYRLLMKFAAAFMSAWDKSLLRKALFADAGLSAYFMGSFAAKPFLAVAGLYGKVDFVGHSAILRYFSGFAEACLSSPARLLSGSFAARLLLGFFGVELEITESKWKKSYFIPIVLLIAVCAAIAVFLSPLYALMAFAGFFGVLFILYRPVAGVFAAAFLIPIMPTKIILAVTLLTVLSYFANLLNGKIMFTPDISDFFTVLFALLLAYGTVISFKPLGSAPKAMVYILFIVFSIAAKNLLNSRAKIFGAFSAVISSGFLVSLYGIYQRLSGNLEETAAWLDAEMFEEVGARVYATLENPNVLGEYLIILITFSVAALYYFKKPIYKAIMIGIIGAGGLCMVFTLSRGAWLGLIAAALIFVFVCDRRLIWLILLALLLSPLIMPQSILDRFLSIGNVSDSSTNYRLNIWLASLIMLKVFWPVGVGPGEAAFVYIYSVFAFNASVAQHSHNLFLQIVIDIGIFGLITFLGYVFTYMKSALMASKSPDKFVKYASGALVAGMAGYLVQGLTDNVWYNYRVVCLFWLLIALSGAMLNLRNTENADGGENA